MEALKQLTLLFFFTCTTAILGPSSCNREERGMALESISPSHAGVRTSASSEQRYDHLFDKMASPPFINISQTSLEFYKPGCWGEPELAFQADLEDGIYPSKKEHQHNIPDLAKALSTYGQEHKRRMQQSKESLKSIAGQAGLFLGLFHYYEEQRTRYCHPALPLGACNDRYEYPAVIYIMSDLDFASRIHNMVSASHSSYTNTLLVFTPILTRSNLKDTVRLKLAAHTSGIPQLACLLKRNPMALLDLFGSLIPTQHGQFQPRQTTRRTTE